MAWRRVLVLITVVGCEPDEDGPGILPDAARSIDASVGIDASTMDAGTMDARVDGAPGDVATVNCTASSTYGSVPSSEYAGSPDPSEVYWLGVIDYGSMPDALQLTLFEGYGAFVNGITPQTVQLVGEELAYQTCGACIFMFTDLHTVGMDIEVTDYYMPTGGTVELTSVSGQFQGTITNLTLQHMVISGSELVPANDGCMVTIPSLTMDALIE